MVRSHRLSDPTVIVYHRIRIRFHIASIILTVILRKFFGQPRKRLIIYKQLQRILIMANMQFGSKDIKSLDFEVRFEKIALDTLHNKLEAIERGKFLSGSITSDSFIKFLEDNIPSLELTGDGFNIGVYPHSIRLSMPDVRRNNRITQVSDMISDPEKIFSSEELQKISVDFNSIVSFVLAKLGIEYKSTTFMVRINLRKNKVDYQTDKLSEAINPSIQSIIGDNSEVQSAGVEFKTKEMFLGKSVKAFYNLSKRGLRDIERTDAVVFSGWFSFENTGVQDLAEMAEEYVKHVNNTIEKLVGGLKPNE